jgi:hypothetical protein
MFKYYFFGLRFKSSFELPGIATTDFIEAEQDIIQIKIGKTPKTLVNGVKAQKPFSCYNETELLYTFPEIANYYISNGNEICIEPFADDLSEVLQLFYSSALAAILLQRNLIPFHASGVKINDNKIILLSAPSGVGKSTTAVFLEELGYPIFSDDTVLLEIIDGKCLATSSYPILRLWQNSFENSEHYELDDAFQIRPDISKYGFYFNEKFSFEKMEVAAFVFLKVTLEEINIQPLKAMDLIGHLINNIYTKNWMEGMNKLGVQFQLASSISQRVPGFIANRPKKKSTFKEFSALIEKEIIVKFNGNLE